MAGADITHAERYVHGTQKERWKIAQDVFKRVTRRFGQSATGSYSNHLPMCMDGETGLYFRYIPGGTFRLGLSDDEEMAADAISPIYREHYTRMRPCREVTVCGFLMMVTTLINRDYWRLTNQPVVPFKGIDFPAMMTHEDAVALGSRFGYRLATEAEWEYACRAMTTSLFVWGDSLLDDDGLDRWLINDFCGFQQLESNAFGLHGLFHGEWCADRWRADHAESTQPSETEFVARAGGSQFWPWQDQEWINCVSAMRLPSSALFDDRCVAVRFVVDIPDLPQGW